MRLYNALLSIKYYNLKLLTLLQILNMRVVHLPSSVGGNAWGLSQAEKLLGIDSKVIYLKGNYLNYPADKIIFPDSTNTFLKKITRVFPLLSETRNIIRNHDVFHFNFGSSLFDFPYPNFVLLDVPYFKKHGKVIVTFNGCDARQKYSTMNRVNYSSCQNVDCNSGICNSGKLDKLRKARIKKFDKYADHIFSVNPDLLYFLPERAKFLPYTISKWNELEVSPHTDVKDVITIIHAPTSKSAKGSEIIIEAMNNIKLKYGNKVNFILVENTPNQEAIKIYSQADLIIDQLLIGWYGGFAVEAMKMGKPIMVFIREEDLKFIPKQMAEDCRKTFINAWKGNIFEKLCNIIENPQLLNQYHNFSLDYVNKWHNPRYVASIVNEAYKS